MLYRRGQMPVCVSPLMMELIQSYAIASSRLHLTSGFISHTILCAGEPHSQGN